MNIREIVTCLVTVTVHTFADGDIDCVAPRTASFVRWSGLSPERAPPVFLYSAGDGETSLVGACIARCHELAECKAIVVHHQQGNCYGVAATYSELRQDNNVAYFKKMCIEQGADCSRRWWFAESVAGYRLHSEGGNLRAVLNATLTDCHHALMAPVAAGLYRSAQWIGTDGNTEAGFDMSEEIGTCILNEEDKFTEPEAYRVSNYKTVYIENQCRHDYPKKIDRCSYEEYHNQTLRHIDMTFKNFTKNDCKAACESEDRFVCRGFTFYRREDPAARGFCDLHSEDLVTAGSWLLRRVPTATYYRRVVCLNISVECEDDNLVITYRPRGTFHGRVYVPGRGERCSARTGPRGDVRLVLPLRGDCDVNFAHAISSGPTGIINRTMAYVMVMVQTNPIIQTGGDRWVRVGCSPGARTATVVDAVLAIRDDSRPTLASEAGSADSAGSASAVYAANTAPLTMYAVRASSGPAAPAVPSGPAALGEPLELRVETTETSEIDVYHLVASSHLGDSSVLLLDSRGCPTGQVDFPMFTRSWVGGTQRLSARFKAFRFPTSHVVRFALMVRFCQDKCPTVECNPRQMGRTARKTGNVTYGWENSLTAFIQDDNGQQNADSVVAQESQVGCKEGGSKVPLQLEIAVGSRNVLSAETLIRADQRAEEWVAGAVCVHEAVAVSLALAWLAVQILLLLGCCVLVKRYRNLAEMSMHKEYQAFDNVGFDTGVTHRRVHWPDQTMDVYNT